MLAEKPSDTQTRPRPASSGSLRSIDPVRLETLPDHWRWTFQAANAALTAAGRCRHSTGLPSAEIADWSRRVAAERDAVSKLLDAIAREEHVRFQRSLAAPPATTRALGLPTGVRACLFDLDGVLTGSAPVHAAAWRDTLDRMLRERAEDAGHHFDVRYFDLAKDYYGLIHGRPRLDGIRAFLDSRGMHLPEGRADDPPGSGTVHAVANRKNAAFQRRLSVEPMAVLAGAAAYLETAREAGLARAVISPSANTETILEHAGLAHLIQACVDGRVVEREGIEWKPAPDALVLACRQLDVTPEDAAAFETLPAGVAAARAAGVGFVVGLDRHGKDTLRSAGADVVVADLSELLDPRFAG
jgi:beta-phosphoglucomutase-like phosphatase (HAD superfamily)